MNWVANDIHFVIARLYQKRVELSLYLCIIGWTLKNISCPVTVDGLGYFCHFTCTDSIVLVFIHQLHAHKEHYKLIAYNKGNCYATFMLSNKTHLPVELRGTRKHLLCTKSYVSLSLFIPMCNGFIHIYVIV